MSFAGGSFGILRGVKRVIMKFTDVIFYIGGRFRLYSRQKSGIISIEERFGTKGAAKPWQ